MKSSYWLKDIRTHLKNVFWPNIFVGASFQILDNQQVACGSKLGPAAILNQNPIFEMASKICLQFRSPPGEHQQGIIGLLDF